MPAREMNEPAPPAAGVVPATTSHAIATLYPSSSAAACAMSVTDASPARHAAIDCCPAAKCHECMSECTASEAIASSKTQPPKRVQWSTVTVHEFGVVLGASTVPTRGGAPIGLANECKASWTCRLDDVDEEAHGVRRFTPEERVRLLTAASVRDAFITRSARETNIILKSRRRTLVCEMEDSDESSSDDDDEEDEVVPSRRGPRVCKRPAMDPGMSFVRRPRMLPANY